MRLPSGLTNLYRHVLGSAVADELMYEEKDERFRIDMERTRSGAYLLLGATATRRARCDFCGRISHSGEFQLIAAREDDHEYYVDHHPGSADGSGGRHLFHSHEQRRTDLSVGDRAGAGIRRGQLA